MNVLSVQIGKWMISGMALLVPVASIAFYVLSASDRIVFLSEASLVSAYQQLEPKAERPLFYLNYLPVSASFYARGEVARLNSADAELIQTGFWLAAHKSLNDAPSRDCQLQFQAQRGVFDLYLCHGETKKQ